MNFILIMEKIDAIDGSYHKLFNLNTHAHLQGMLSSRIAGIAILIPVGECAVQVNVPGYPSSSTVVNGVVAVTAPRVNMPSFGQLRTIAYTDVVVPTTLDVYL